MKLILLFNRKLVVIPTKTSVTKIKELENEDPVLSLEDIANPLSSLDSLNISKDTSNDTPQTGDDSNPALWLMLMLLSMSALVGLFIRKKKDRK